MYPAIQLLNSWFKIVNGIKVTETLSVVWCDSRQ